MLPITSCSSQFFKPISKDTFSKYKKVRTMHSPLMGEHQLYSKDGVKYILKQLPVDQQFYTTRPCSTVFIHKYIAPKAATTSYIYPVIGIGLDMVIEYSNVLKHGSGAKQMLTQAVGQSEAAKEYANLLSRHCNSQEKVLTHVLKFLMQLTLIARQEQHLITQLNDSTSCSHQSSTKNLIQSATKQGKQPPPNNNTLTIPAFDIPILLQCIHVHNGELFYCYDTWMNSETQIVVSDLREIENLFLENSQLNDIQQIYVKQVKRQLQNKQNHTQLESQIAHKPHLSLQTIIQKPLSLFSALFKPFLLILFIGSMQLNLRLYECGSFTLSYQNLEKRIHHFKLKHNSSKDKLATLLQKVLFSQKPNHQQVKLSQILSVFKDSTPKAYDLTSSGCKSDLQSSSVKAPKRVTLAKKNKIQKFDNIHLCQSLIKNQQSQIASSLYASLTYQQPFAQTAESSQNYNSVQNYESCRQENSHCKKSATKNRTLSGMVLKQCNSLQKLERNEMLIIEEKEVFGQSGHKNRSLSKKEPVTSTKKNKQNIKPHCGLSSSNNKHRAPTQPSSKSVKKCLFTPQLISKIIQSFQSLSQLSACYNCSLLKLLTLEYTQSNSALEQLLLNKLSHVIVNQHWVTKLYSDNSFYFGEIANLTSTHVNSGTVDTEKRHGVGVYIFPSKDLYFGHWKDNLMHGHGTYMFQSGEVYAGELFNGHKHGFGAFWYADGKRYEGFWKNDHKVGLGNVYFSKIDPLTQNNEVVKFLGEFKQPKSDNEVEGIFTGYDNSSKVWSKQGNLQEFDPVRFQFRPKNKANRFSSINIQGKRQKLLDCSVLKYRQLIDSLGQKYSGEVSEDKKNGYGIEQTDDYHFEGHFIDDQRNGRGKLVTSDNMAIEGVWIDGLMVEYVLE